MKKNVSTERVALSNPWYKKFVYINRAENTWPNGLLSLAKQFKVERCGGGSCRNKRERERESQ